MSRVKYHANLDCPVSNRIRDKVTNLEQMLKESGENAKAQVSDLEYQLGRFESETLTLFPRLIYAGRGNVKSF